MKINNERGIAMVIGLFLLVTLMGFSAIFIVRTVHENNTAKRELSLVKSFYLAEAGSQHSLDQMDTLVNTFMQNTVNETNPSTLISDASTYAANQDGIGFLIDYVENSGTEVLTASGASAVFSLNNTSMGSGDYDLTITVSEKQDPVIVTANTWDFPYDYQIQSSGTVGSEQQNILVNGDFTVRVQKDNFARYALFTNEQISERNTTVWFTGSTHFSGPVHTNGRFNIYGNPGSVFEDAVTQSEQLARFYNGSSPSILADADFNGTKDVPTWNGGFTRGVDPITLSSPVQEQSMIDQALGGSSVSGNGIYVPDSSGTLSGGIYVEGNGTINMSVDGNNNAVYDITQGSTRKIITVNRSTNTTNVNTVGGGAVDYTGVPDGVDGVGTVIYVNGEVSSIGGTVQQDTKLSVASSSHLTIQDNIVYQSHTAAVGSPGDANYEPVSANGYDNILGLVSWSGEVRIGTSAPDDVNIHATSLARQGVVRVVDHNDWGVGGRGTATMLGGIVSDGYGAFGQFNSSTGEMGAGYGRNFVYDERMESGSAPPYFPSLNTFIAFTNDITDKMIFQEGS